MWNSINVEFVDFWERVKHIDVVLVKPWCPIRHYCLLHHSSTWKQVAGSNVYDAVIRCCDIPPRPQSHSSSTSTLLRFCTCSVVLLYPFSISLKQAYDLTILSSGNPFKLKITEIYDLKLDSQEHANYMASCLVLLHKKYQWFVLKNNFKLNISCY